MKWLVFVAAAVVLACSTACQQSRLGVNSVNEVSTAVTPVLDHLAFNQSPQSVPAGADVTFSIMAVDNFGNPMPGVSITVTAGSISITGTTDPQGLYDGTFPQFSTSVGSFRFVAQAAGLAAGKTVQNLQAVFGVVPGPLDHLSFVPNQSPTNILADGTLAFAVGAFDVYNNPEPGTALTLNNGLVQSSIQTNAQGIFQASYPNYTKSAGNYTVQVTSPTVPAAKLSSTFSVLPGPVAALTFTVAPANITVGGTLTFTVGSFDAFSNPIPNVNIVVNNGFSSSNQATNAQGLYAASFPNISTVAGNENVTVTTAANAAVTVSSPYVIMAGPAAGLHFVTEPQSVAAGQALAFSISPQDQFSNLANFPSGSVCTVALTSNTSGGLIGGTFQNIPASGSQLNINGVVIQKSGTYALAVSCTGIAASTPSSSPFTVSPGPAANLSVATQPPSSVLSGQSFNVTVDVMDAFGNPVSSGNVAASLLGTGSLGGTSSQSVNNGVAAFTGLNVTVTATTTVGLAFSLGTIKVDSNTFTVSLAPAIGSVQLGQIGVTEFTGVLYAGYTLVNSVPTDLPVTVYTFASNGAAIIPPSGFTCGLAVVTGPSGSPTGLLGQTVADGISTSLGLNNVVLSKVGTYTFEAQCSYNGNSFTSQVSGPVNIIAGPVNLTVSSPPPASVLSGQYFGYALSCTDAYNNPCDSSTVFTEAPVTANGVLDFGTTATFGGTLTTGSLTQSSPGVFQTKSALLGGAQNGSYTFKITAGNPNPTAPSASANITVALSGPGPLSSNQVLAVGGTTGALYVLTDHGFSVSTDNGASFYNFENGANLAPNLCFGIGPNYNLSGPTHSIYRIWATSSRVLIANDNVDGICSSSDGGLTWQPVSINGTQLLPDGSAISPNEMAVSGNTVAALVYGGMPSGTSVSEVAISSDGGATFTIPANPFQFPGGVNSISEANGAFFVASLGSGLFESTDGGQTFQFVSTPLYSTRFPSCSSPSSCTFSAAAEGGGTFRYDNVDYNGYPDDFVPMPGVVMTELSLPDNSISGLFASGTCFYSALNGNKITATSSQNCHPDNYIKMRSSGGAIYMLDATANALASSTDGGITVNNLVSYATVESSLGQEDLNLVNGTVYFYYQPTNSSLPGLYATSGGTATALSYSGAPP